MNLYRQHRNSNCISSLPSFLLPVFSQNILSWKGSIRVIKSKSSVNGPYWDQTHTLGVNTTMLQPTELMWRASLSPQRMERREESLIFLFFSLVLRLNKPFTQRYHIHAVLSDMKPHTK